MTADFEMPRELPPREVPDLSGLEEAEFNELKKLYADVVSRITICIIARHSSLHRHKTQTSTSHGTRSSRPLRTSKAASTATPAHRLSQPFVKSTIASSQSSLYSSYTGSAMPTRSSSLLAQKLQRRSVPSPGTVSAKLMRPGLRARRRKHTKLGRSMDKLLRLQS